LVVVATDEHVGRTAQEVGTKHVRVADGIEGFDDILQEGR